MVSTEGSATSNNVQTIGPSVQTFDSNIQLVNHYPVDKY